jgi:hypothetical protein
LLGGRGRNNIDEDVGEQVTNKEVEIWDQTPMKDRWVWFAVDVEVRAEPTAE